MLCLGTLLSIVVECKSSEKKSTQKRVTSEYLKSVYSDFDESDDSTISKLVGGKINPSEEFMHRFEELKSDDYQYVVQDISDNLICLLNDNKHSLIVDAIKLLIKNDDTIHPNTIVDVVSKTSKECLQNAKVDIATLLAGVLIYALKNTDNRNETGTVKRCARECIEKARKNQKELQTETLSSKGKFDTSLSETVSSNVKFFKQNLFTAEGAAVVVGKWNEANTHDVAIIEAITGLKYVDYAETLRVSEEIVMTRTREVCIVNNLLDLRDKLIVEIFGEHINLFLEEFYEALLRITEFSSISEEMLFALFDFIAFVGTHIYKSNRVDSRQWQNYIYVFAKRVFQSNSDFAIKALVNWYEIFIEGSLQIGLDLISEQIEDSDSRLIEMLKSDDRLSVSYQLANAISKAAVPADTFSNAIVVLNSLRKYNDIFYQMMICIMKTDYVQTKAPLKKKLGVIKKLLRIDKDIAWEFVANLLPGSTNTSFILCNFRYLPVGTMELTKEEYVNEVNAYIDILCDNLGDNPEQIIELLRIMNTSSDRNALVIAESIKKHSLNCKVNMSIYEKLVQMAENYMQYSEDRKKALVELRCCFQPAKKVYERCSLFSRDSFTSNRKKSEVDENQCILSIVKSEGLEGIVTFASSVEDMHSVALAIRRNLDIEDYFNLLKSVPSKENNLLMMYLVSIMSDEELVLYCNEICSTGMRATVLSMHNVSDAIVEYINTLEEFETVNYWKNASFFGCFNLSEDNYEQLIAKTIEYQNYSASIHLIYWKVEKRNISLEQIYSILELFEFDEDHERDNAQSSTRFEIQIMIKTLQESEDPDIDRLVSIEEKYLNLLLPDEITSPKFIWFKMANNPQYVCGLLVRLNEQFSISLYNLFCYFRITPGLQLDGVLDYEKTMEWYKYATEVNSEKIRAEMLDMFGRSLFYAEADQDGFLMDRRIADFLEEYANDDLLRAFEVQAFNSEGAYVVTPESHDLDLIIDKFEFKADKFEEEGYLNISSIFRRVADAYRYEYERN